MVVVRWWRGSVVACGAQDPDVLAGWEVQQASWGFLEARATALGHAHINIEDLDLVPAVAGEPAGALTIVVDSDESARKAAALVGERGYRVIAGP